jgi:hypothetical protein
MKLDVNPISSQLGAMLKPQDIVILLKVHNCRESAWTYAELASSLKMSASEVHAALKRCEDSTLYDRSSRKIRRQALLEFLVHGLKYVFPAKPGALSRGVPTAHSAEPLQDLLTTNPFDAYVWPDPSGTLKGQSIEPLHKSVPIAIKTDPELHRLLSLIDAIRVGRIREQQLAQHELEKRLAT